MFSKEDRNIIYTQAKEMYLKDIKEGAFFGMCMEISCASMFHYRINIQAVEVPKHFPEMEKLRVKFASTKKQNGLWWDRSETKVRLQMFDYLIKITQ